MIHFIKKVVIEGGIESIGSNAFYHAIILQI